MAKDTTPTTRLDDMLERYGEVCSQKQASQILSVQPRSIYRMMCEGRLRRVGHRVDVRSIAELIENTDSTGLPMRTVGQRANSRQPNGKEYTGKRSTIGEGAFFVAAKSARERA